LEYLCHKKAHALFEADDQAYFRSSGEGVFSNRAQKNASLAVLRLIAAVKKNVSSTWNACNLNEEVTFMGQCSKGF